MVDIKNEFVEKLKQYKQAWSMFTDFAYYEAVKSLHALAEKMGHAQEDVGGVPPKNDLELGFSMLPFEWQMGILTKFIDEQKLYIIVINAGRGYPLDEKRDTVVFMSKEKEWEPMQFVWQVVDSKQRMVYYQPEDINAKSREEAYKEGILKAFSLIKWEETSE